MSDARFPCPLCFQTLKSKDSLRGHVKRHEQKDNNSTIGPQFNQGVKPVVQPVVEKQDMDVHRTQRGLPEEKNYLAQYLKERDNYYDSRDFDKYEAKMKARDDKRRENPADPSNSGQLLNCHICHLSFPNKEARDDHLDARHPKCEECEDRFIDHAQANKHYTTYHDQQPLIQSSQCPECSQSFSSKEELAQHLHSKHRKQKDLGLPLVNNQVAYKDHFDANQLEVDANSSKLKNPDATRVEFNRVALERFRKVRNLIKNNDFRTLTKNTLFLRVLGETMGLVADGRVRLTFQQLSAINSRQERLLDQLADGASSGAIVRSPRQWGKFVRKERRDISLIFDVIASSVAAYIYEKICNKI